MKKAFKFIYLNKKITLFILTFVFLFSSCTASKDTCAAYAYDETKKGKKNSLITNL